MPYDVLVTLNIDDNYRAKIQAASPNSRFTYCRWRDLTPEIVRAADVILGNVPSAMLQASPRLRLLQLNTAGADGYLDPGVLHPDTALANATGAFGLAIGEHMLAMLLTLIKRLHQYRDNQNQCLWKDRGSVTSVQDSVIAVVGLGDIGGAFAKMVKALGARTIGVRRADTRKPDYLDELVLTGELDSVLPRADVVALSLPGVPETYRLFGAGRIARCKPGVVLLNVGRGNVFDTDALCDALESGHVGGAGLDVTDPEPLPPDHRLWRIENALVTPHISGFYHLEHTRRLIVERAAENLRRLEEGLPIISQVDRETGYRKLM